VIQFQKWLSYRPLAKATELMMTMQMTLPMAIAVTQGVGAVLGVAGYFVGMAGKQAALASTGMPQPIGANLTTLGLGLIGLGILMLLSGLEVFEL
jgi:hypothetical protein